MQDQDSGTDGEWGPEGEEVTRVVVASQSTVDRSVYTQMERIRASAVRHNVPAGVATALLYQSGWFVQWKEGPAEAVDRIMERIATDWRHHSPRVLHRSHGVRLLAGPWSMAMVQAGENPADMTRRVTLLRHAWEAGVYRSPAAVWRQLSTPMAHPGADRQADPDAFQRVLVCASMGSGSFELVHWLAARERQSVVHRRFAGAEDLDVGTDLVDFAEDDRTMRVIAMARKGLLLPLTRAFLPDYSHVLLLLGGDADRDTALVRRVGHACANLPSVPVLLGVARESRHHAEAFAAAHRAGLVYLDHVADVDSSESVWAAVQPAFGQWRAAANSSSLPDALRRA